MNSTSDEKPVCVKCGSDRLMRDIPHRSDPIKIDAPTPEYETFFGLPVSRIVKSECSHFILTVCADCGYVEFYAEDPEALWRVYNYKNR